MEKKINEWVEKGFIDKDTAFNLLKDVKEDKEKLRKIRINITIYTVAVIFLGIGIISFIASNDWLLKLLNSSNLLKILLMMSAVFASFWGGYKLSYENKSFPKLGKSLIVLSTFLVGGLYALIGQTYNINANNSSLMFVWLLSILPVAYLFKMRAVNILSILLFILGVIFYYAELALDKLEIWTIYIPVMTGAFLYTAGNIPFIREKYNDFSIQYKITGALPVFITLLILTCSVEPSYHLISAFYIIPVAFLILFNVLIFVFEKIPETILKVETSFIISLLVSLLIILCVPDINTVLIIILSNIALILMMAFGFNYGYKFEKERIIGVTNWMLIVYIAVNYCRWGWSLMDKALFFILGGVILLSLGLYLEKSKKKIVAKENN